MTDPKHEAAAAPETEAAKLEELADQFLADTGAEADPRDGEIASLQAEISTIKDRMLRFAAEAENQKKRLEREKSEATLYAASNFARDLLGVADSLSRALAAVPAEERDVIDDVMKKFLDGIELTEREV
jgi:molecular chaperone GrpE